MFIETPYFNAVQMIGGERGIRTLDGLLTHTPLAGERFRPLSQLSVSYFDNINNYKMNATS